MKGILLRKGVYHLSFTVNGRRIRESCETANKQLAERIYQKRHREEIERTVLGDVDTSFTFNQLADKYLTEHSRPKKKSTVSDERYLKQLRPAFGELCLVDIKDRDIEHYRTSRRKTIKSSSMNRELALLSNMFNKAIKWGCLKSNPMSTVEREKENNATRRALSLEEIRRLLYYSKGLNKEKYLIALNTGLRSANVRGLHKAQLNFEQRKINIPGAEMKGGQDFVCPMNDVVYNVLSLRFHENTIEKPYDYDSKKSLATSLEKAKIMGITFHCFRHTFSSMLDELDVDPIMVSALLGHATIGKMDITMRYIHRKWSKFVEAASKLDALYGPLLDATPDTNLAQMPAAVS